MSSSLVKAMVAYGIETRVAQRFMILEPRISRSSLNRRSVPARGEKERTSCAITRSGQPAPRDALPLGYKTGQAAYG